MGPERSTQGIWVITTFLGAAAILAGDPTFFFATFSLVLLSAALAMRFRFRMHRIVTSARVTRSSDRKVLQQGGITTVTTGFSCSPDPGMIIRVRDLLPPASLSDPANPSAVVAADGSATLRYSFTPLIAGSSCFPGIALTISDAFFSGSLVMGSDPFRGPELDVHPHAAYERFHIRKDYGTQEKDAHSIFHGYGIRSIREYIAGDDLRSIDWKMTAKHDKMIIREYTAVENLPPLIVLDLPDRSFLVPEEHMAKLINEVAGETVTAIRNCGSVSLFLISGINVIDIILEETDVQRCITAIRTSAHPRFRLNHAYRWKDRASMRGSIRKSGDGVSFQKKDESGPFLTKIAQIYRRSLASPYVPAFSTQVNRLLSSLKLEEIVLYSLFEGDLSHIGEISHQAQARRIRLRSKTVAVQDGEKIFLIKKTLRKVTMEIIP